MRPMSYNPWLYVYANPINWVDPSGFIGCQKPNTDVSLGYFAYKKGSCTYGTGLLVNFRSPPWNQYASSTAPSGTVRVPLRHALDLDPSFSCDTAAKAQAFYASSRFEDWEVNARNILGEMGAVIGISAEWALRDAIGVGYIPYNRKTWNENHQGSNDYYYHTYTNGNISTVRALILAGSQSAITHNDSFNRTLHGLNLGKDAQTIHEITLIIAYGVEKRYFLDTSFGATIFAHRPPNEPYWEWDGEMWQSKGNRSGLECGQTGPAFFKSGPDVPNYPQNNITTAQLFAQGGWQDGTVADDSYLPSVCKSFTLGESMPTVDGKKVGCTKKIDNPITCP